MRREMSREVQRPAQRRLPTEYVSPDLLSGLQYTQFSLSFASDYNFREHYVEVASVRPSVVPKNNTHITTYIYSLHIYTHYSISVQLDFSSRPKHAKYIFLENFQTEVELVSEINEKKKQSSI
jgi:hypothetical protein